MTNVHDHNALGSVQTVDQQGLASERLASQLK
jgi:hypothetical protein